MIPTIGIHPADKDLNFLLPINKYFSALLGDGYKYYRLEANYHSHEDCLKTLLANKSGVLFFFCHSLEKSIRGCKIKHRASSLAYKDFSYGNFISPENNLAVFEGKKVFCLACHSRDLGKYAIGAGAEVFLGFGDIPFYIKENWKETTIEAALKKELATLIRICLGIFIEKNFTFNQLASYLELLFDKRRWELLADRSKGTRIRIEVANILSQIKNGIVMFGNGELHYA
jgi:hypothetical protein